MAALHSRSMLFLLNGKAAQDEQVREWIGAQRKQGRRIEVRALWEGGQALDFAARAREMGVDAVVAAGGDGTINEIVNGLMRIDEGRPALGVLPFGTANDFAAGLGLDSGQLEQALDNLLHAKPSSIDVARVNERFFLNVASGGFPAEITTETPLPLKRLLGGFAYSLTGLAKALDVTTRSVRLHAPDFDWEGPILFFAVANGRFAGGGFPAAPNALLDDGKLDVLAVPDMTIGQLVASLDNIIHGVGTEQAPRVQVQWLEVEAPDGVQVNVDGEPVFCKSYRFELAGKIQLLATIPRD